jgi:hypothetical protein
LYVDFFFEDVRALGAWRPCPPDSFANLRFAVYWAKGVGGNFTCLFIVCRKAVLERAFLTGDKEKVWKFSISYLSANRLHLAIASGKSKISRANKTK